MDPKITQLIQHLKTKPIKLDGLKESTLDIRPEVWVRIRHLGKVS